MSRDLITPNVLGNKVGAVALTLQNGTTDVAENVLSDEGKMHVLPHYWNPGTLGYEVATGGGSGVGTEVEVTKLSAAY